MATFEELMEQFRNPGDTGLPENFADELASAYTNDLSVRDAAVTEKENALTEAQKIIDAKDAEITRVKAVNYDLIKAAPKAGEPAANQEQDGATEKRGVSSLFE